MTARPLMAPSCLPQPGSRPRRFLRASAALAAATLAAHVGFADGAYPQGPPSVPSAALVVAQRFPHQTSCFTEGFFLNGTEVFESCGLYAKSYIRRYSVYSGETLFTQKVPREFFGEGLSVLNDRMFLLTYKHHIALEYTTAGFQQVRTHPYPYGEGWGLTTDGCDLFTTTGSEYIFRLRPDAAGTLQLVEKVAVTAGGKKVRMLNEVEYVTPKIWVNQWGTNFIYRVEPTTGIVELTLDIRSLYRWRGEATPNGIAYSTALGQNWLVVTGKLWPEMFALELSTADLCGGAGSSAPVCAKAPPSACWQPPAAQTTPAPQTTPATQTTPAWAASNAEVPAGAMAAAPTVVQAAGGLSSAAAVPRPPSSQEFVPPAPLPILYTLLCSGSAFVLAVAAVWVPIFVRGYRQRYTTTRHARVDTAASL